MILTLIIFFASAAVLVAIVAIRSHEVAHGRIRYISPIKGVGAVRTEEPGIKTIERTYRAFKLHSKDLIQAGAVHILRWCVKITFHAIFFIRRLFAKLSSAANRYLNKPSSRSQTGSNSRFLHAVRRYKHEVRRYQEKIEDAPSGDK